MKKVLTILSVLTLMMTTTAAFAEPQPPKIAVVDIQKVVAASSQVKALKSSQEAKNKELAAFIKKAQADVNKQTDIKKKKSLAESYEKQLAQKREANLKEYTTKLKAADAAITAQIGKKATELGYTMVLPKSALRIFLYVAGLAASREKLTSWRGESRSFSAKCLFNAAPLLLIEILGVLLWCSLIYPIIFQKAGLIKGSPLPIN